MWFRESSFSLLASSVSGVGLRLAQEEAYEVPWRLARERDRIISFYHWCYRIKEKGMNEGSKYPWGHTRQARLDQSRACQINPFSKCCIRSTSKNISCRRQCSGLGMMGKSNTTKCRTRPTRLRLNRYAWSGNPIVQLTQPKDINWNAFRSGAALDCCTCHINMDLWTVKPFLIQWKANKCTTTRVLQLVSPPPNSFHSVDASWTVF